MAVEVIGSRYTCRTNYIIAAVCVVFALWFLYDGWGNEEFQKEHTIIDEQTGQERPDGYRDTSDAFSAASGCQYACCMAASASGPDPAGAVNSRLHSGHTTACPAY